MIYFVFLIDHKGSGNDFQQNLLILSRPKAKVETEKLINDLQKVIDEDHYPEIYSLFLLGEEQITPGIKEANTHRLILGPCSSIKTRKKINKLLGW
jgi:hypothetical protein